MGIQERKEREKQQRREDIINAAEKIFFKKGVQNATMDDVANEAELSKGTLYLYFKSKAELHFAICVRGLVILKEIFQKSINQNQTALDNLINIGRAYVKYAYEYSDYFKVMMYFEGIDNEMCEGCIYEHTPKDDVLGFLDELLDKGKLEGSIRKDISSRVLSHLLWLQTTGVLQFIIDNNMHCDAHNVSEEDIIQSHMEIIANGIRPTDAPKIQTNFIENK